MQCRTLCDTTVRVKPLQKSHAYRCATERVAQKKKEGARSALASPASYALLHIIIIILTCYTMCCTAGTHNAERSFETPRGGRAVEVNTYRNLIIVRTK